MYRALCFIVKFYLLLVISLPLAAEEVTPHFDSINVRGWFNSWTELEMDYIGNHTWSATISGIPADLQLGFKFDTWLASDSDGDWGDAFGAPSGQRLSRYLNAGDILTPLPTGIVTFILAISAKDKNLANYYVLNGEDYDPAVHVPPLASNYRGVVYRGNQFTVPVGENHVWGKLPMSLKADNLWSLMLDYQDSGDTLKFDFYGWDEESNTKWTDPIDWRNGAGDGTDSEPADGFIDFDSSGNAKNISFPQVNGQYELTLNDVTGEYKLESVVQDDASLASAHSTVYIRQFVGPSFASQMALVDHNWWEIDVRLTNNSRFKFDGHGGDQDHHADHPLEDKYNNWLHGYGDGVIFAGQQDEYYEGSDLPRGIKTQPDGLVDSDWDIHNKITQIYDSRDITVKNEVSVSGQYRVQFRDTTPREYYVLPVPDKTSQTANGIFVEFSFDNSGETISRNFQSIGNNEWQVSIRTFQESKPSFVIHDGGQVYGELDGEVDSISYLRSGKLDLDGQKIKLLDGPRTYKIKYNSLTQDYSVTLDDEWRRTVIFVEHANDASLSERIYLNGGLAFANGIPIRHRIKADHSWFYYDTKLDNDTAGEPGQLSAQGSPMVLSSNVLDSETSLTVENDGSGYSPLNKIGDGVYMLDVDMDCDATNAGWFEVSVLTTKGKQDNATATAEDDIMQVNRASIGFPSSTKHIAQCGKINVFTHNGNASNHYDFPASMQVNSPDQTETQNLLYEARTEIVFADINGDIDFDDLKITIDGREWLHSCSKNAQTVTCTLQGEAIEDRKHLLSIVGKNSSGKVVLSNEVSFVRDANPPEITLVKDELDYTGEQHYNSIFTLSGSINEPVNTLTAIVKNGDKPDDGDGSINCDDGCSTEYSVTFDNGTGAFSVALDPAVSPVVDGIKTLYLTGTDLFYIAAKEDNKSTHTTTKILKIFYDTATPASVNTNKVSLFPIDRSRVRLVAYKNSNKLCPVDFSGTDCAAEEFSKVIVVNDSRADHPTTNAKARTDAKGWFEVILNAYPDEQLTIYTSDRANNMSEGISLTVPKNHVYDFFQIDPPLSAANE